MFKVWLSFSPFFHMNVIFSKWFGIWPIVKQLCRHQRSCSHSGETAAAEWAGCSRNAIAVLWCHTWQWRGVGAGSSWTNFLTGMHCFKSAADRSARRCMKSNTPIVSQKKESTLNHWNESFLKQIPSRFMLTSTWNISILPAHRPGKTCFSRWSVWTCKFILCH